MAQGQAYIPWSTSGDGTIQNANGKPVAVALSGCGCGDFLHHKGWWRDKAHFIVLAVNAHEELLAALEEDAQLLEDWATLLRKECPALNVGTLDGSAKRSRAAVAKAQGEG